MANIIIIKNTDLDKVAQTIAESKKDKQSLRKPVKLQGEWSLDPTKVKMNLLIHFNHLLKIVVLKADMKGMTEVRVILLLLRLEG